MIQGGTIHGCKPEKSMFHRLKLLAFDICFGEYSSILWL